MAKKKSETVTATNGAVPDAVPENDGTIKGTKAVRRAQPSTTQVAFRDFAAGLGAYFTRTDPEDGDAAALEAFAGRGKNPWDIFSRSQVNSYDEAVLDARIIANALDEFADFDDWRDCPWLHEPPDIAFLDILDTRMMALNRANRWEMLQFGTGIVAPDLMKQTRKESR